MRFSDAPTYRSGHYAFTLQRSYTYPGPASIPGESYMYGLVAVAPLREDVDPDTLHGALAGRVDRKALLYMRHLQRITQVISRPPLYRRTILLPSRRHFDRR